MKKDMRQRVVTGDQLTMADIKEIQSKTIDELRDDKSKQKLPLFKYQHVKKLLADNTPEETMRIWNEAYRAKVKGKPFDVVSEIQQLKDKVDQIEDKMKDNNTVYLKTEDFTPEPIDFSAVEVSDYYNSVTIVFGKHPNCINLSIPKENFDGFVAAVNGYQGEVKG